MSTPNFPIDFNAIRIALVREMERVTKTTVIMAEQQTQDVPRPCKPYFSYKTLNPADKSGDDSHEWIGDTHNVGGQRRMTISFNCYGNSKEEAYNYMSLWQQSLELWTVQENLRKAGIAVWLIGSVADLTELMNTGYEGRSQMDVSFGIAFNLSESMTTIEKVEAEATIKTGDQTITEEIVIPEEE